MQKTTVLTLSLVFLGILPAVAELGKVWTDFQYYATDLQNYLKSNIPETLRPVEYESQFAVDTATGDLNIPNPIAVGENLRSDVTQKSLSDTFENNPAVQATAASNEINRQITRGAVVGFLGDYGQTRLKTKLEFIEKDLDSLDENLEDLEENHKNILEKIFATTCQIITPANAQLCNSSNQANMQLQNLKIQRNQSKMIGETLANTMWLNQSLQYSNLNLANISQQMEEANRARRVDSSTEAARLLRATSQADLLGVRDTPQVNSGPPTLPRPVAGDNGGADSNFVKNQNSQ